MRTDHFSMVGTPCTASQFVLLALLLSGTAQAPAGTQDTTGDRSVLMRRMPLVSVSIL